MKNEKIAQYISNCPEYARPILTHLRALIHETLPQIEEDLKWQMPSFELDGKIILSFAAYKKHCVLRFWKGIKMDDPDDLLTQIGKTEMSHIGNFSTLDMLPSNAVLKKYILEAKRLSEN